METFAKTRWGSGMHLVMLPSPVVPSRFAARVVRFYCSDLCLSVLANCKTDGSFIFYGRKRIHSCVGHHRDDRRHRFQRFFRKVICPDPNLWIDNKSAITSAKGDLRPRLAGISSSVTGGFVITQGSCFSPRGPYRKRMP